MKNVFDSIKDIYFLDLQHTRELYKDFDLKLRILFVLMKEPNGMSIKQIVRRLGGKYDNVRAKVKDVLAFWNEIGVTHIIFDPENGTFPSPMMWECDVERAEEILTLFKIIHKRLVNEASENGGLERLCLDNKASVYCTSPRKKTTRGMV